MRVLHCWLAIVFVLLLCMGCEKSILKKDAFINAGRKYDLSVEGGFNTRVSAQYIKLTRPALHPDSAPSAIRNASVVVQTGQTNITFRETTPGIYRGTSIGEPNYNEAYTLTIKYDGKTYTAVDTLRPVVNIVDDFLPLSVRTLPDKSISGLIPKHTFGYLNPNKWLIIYKGLDLWLKETVPAWEPAKFEQGKYYSYTHPYGSPNSQYPLNNLRRAFTIGKDEFIYIYKISLSENYARYLYAAFMETDWSGLFSSVPVNVDGNVSGNAQGYFYACDIDFRRYKAGEL